MKTYTLKDGRKVKAVNDLTELALPEACKKCALDKDRNCNDTMSINELPDCVEYNLHFKLVKP